MGDYLKIANGGVLYLCGAVITLLVLLQAFIFIRLSFKEGTKCGLTRQQMFRALRTGAITSLVPSISTVVALIAMVPVLGIPIPWIRQSIMGSTPYELMAAGIGAKSMGVSALGGSGYTSSVFASSIWIMTLGSIWAVLIIVFFLRRLQAGYSKLSNSDPGWRNVLVNSAFMGVFCIFMADPLTTGGIPLVTLVSGGVLMTIFAILIVKLKANWLREFALTFSMIGAMACAVIFSNLL